MIGLAMGILRVVIERIVSLHVRQCIFVCVCALTMPVTRFLLVRRPTC